MRCPLCRRETTWEDNPWRPFCSERCQMADLGRWASEDYRIPQTGEPDLGLPDSDRDFNVDEEK